MNLHQSRIVYFSEATNPLSERELLDLLHESRAYNSIDEIYGFLFYQAPYFLQIIEGETELLNDLFSKIKKDKRHSIIKIIFQDSISNYLFSNWSMGCVDFNNPRLSFIPGISTKLYSDENLNLLTSNLPKISSFFQKHPEFNMK